jgi:carboxypeptidase C (cathepsin A)
MYIPNFASALIENGKVKFKGIMIGNGVMVTEKYWRRRARNTFYSKHYFYGTEIDKMINYCQYDDNDLNNPSCIKGNQLADEVSIN